MQKKPIVPPPVLVLYLYISTFAVYAQKDMSLYTADKTSFNETVWEHVWQINLDYWPAGRSLV